jgi:hypothetical protein
MHQMDDGMKRSPLPSLRYIIDQPMSIRNEITAAYQGRSFKVKSLFDTFAADISFVLLSGFSNPDPETEIESTSQYMRGLTGLEAFRYQSYHGLRTAFVFFLFRRWTGSHFTN